ncbi:MAG: hypothetical protein KA149_10615 [Chitinophagales bacterium]|nr:hypothetical protein [Chitinophagales bacterium]
MKDIEKCILIVLVAGTVLSFKLIDKKVFEFVYPGRPNTGIALAADNFKKFSKEWRGTDYYYYAEGKDGIVCSVLYFKLNDDEKLSLVDVPKAAMGISVNSPAFPLSYFSNYSNLKKYEKNAQSWGEVTDDFMFRQTDVVEFENVKVNQKNMNGYGMAGDDLFVNVHLSKTGYTEADSIKMREMLNSLQRKQ